MLLVVICWLITVVIDCLFVVLELICVFCFVYGFV